MNFRFGFATIFMLSVIVFAGGCSDTCEPCLQIDGDIVSDSDIEADDNPDIDDDSVSDGDVEVVGDSVFEGDIEVDGDIIFDGDIEADADIIPDGDVEADSDVEVDGEAEADGDPEQEDFEDPVPCGHKELAQGLNYACNLDSECATGMCLTAEDGRTTFCSMSCSSTGPDCPVGMHCSDTGGTLGTVCVPDDDGNGRYVTLPGNFTYDLYQPCNYDDDCAGGLCMALNGIKFCSIRNCDQWPDRCGPCGECYDAGTVDPTSDHACVPIGDGATGDDCDYDLDCGNRFCFFGTCTETCSLDGNGDGSGCPEDMTCVSVGDEMNRCVDNTNVYNKGFGEACTWDFECVGNACYENRCNMDCSIAEATRSDGDDCPMDFTCVPLRNGQERCILSTEVAIADEGDACTMDYNCKQGLYCRYEPEEIGDTYLELYEDEWVNVPLLVNDDKSDTDHYSRIEYTLENIEPCYLAVYGRGAGVYALVINYEISTKADYTMESEPNNDTDHAQFVFLSETVYGELSSYDVDYFEFQGMNSGDTVTFETMGRQPLAPSCQPIQ